MSENCNKIHIWFNSLPKLRFPFDEKAIPNNGIYILFEKGEEGHGTNRIVRVGTHTGENQLSSRLNQHFIMRNKDRSIFRKNIGRALLFKNDDPFLSDWEIDLTSKDSKEKYYRTIDFTKQMEVEDDVSKYIHENFEFIVLEAEEKNKRLELESKIISTISKCGECKPTKEWLGLFSPKEKIRESGLWLVNELWKEPLNEEDMNFLYRLLFG